MRTYKFQVVNVFAESTFGGNPLAVFEDATGLSDQEQQTLTDQFNLSETSFIWPASEGSGCAAKVRIFSPGYEMNFAGHPTLGTSFVVGQLLQAGKRFSLELKVGPIEVSSNGGDRWELRSAKPAWSHVIDVPGALGALPGARWVSTGEEQLMVPMRDVESVQRFVPDMGTLLRNKRGHVAMYLFARTGNGFVTRFFWDQHGAIREDPGTGSAAANLGGWHLAQGAALPIAATIEQGHALSRLNVISLRIDEHSNVFVGGRVQPLMRGEVHLP